MQKGLIVTVNEEFIANYDEIIQTYTPRTIGKMINYRILTQCGNSHPQLFLSFPPTSKVRDIFRCGFHSY